MNSNISEGNRSSSNSSFYSQEDVPLEEICDFIMRGKHPDYVDKSEVQVLNQKAVRWDRIEEEHLKYHNSDTEISKNRFIRSYDIVVNSTGVGTLGRVYFFREDPDRMFADSHITIIRADRSEIHPEYLYYILKSPIYQNKIQNIAVGSTGQIELNKGDLTNLKVSFPRKLVQEKIVGIVRPIDEKISTNRATNRILEKIIQSYFKHEFVDYDNYENYKESDIGEIPEGFEVVEVKELCNNIRNGGTPKKSISDYWGGDIPWIKTGELDGIPILQSEEHITQKALEECTCKIVPENTVLVALYGGSVGNTGLTRIPATFNQACCSLQAKPNIGYGFLYQTLKNLKPKLKQLSRGSAQQNISQGIIKEQKVARPPDDELEKFQANISPIYDQIETNMRQNDILKETRDTLLPKLMSGEIRVNDINLEDLEVSNEV